MTRTLIVGDMHIEDSAIEEICAIGNEIIKIKADRIIQLGDLFNKNRPTPKELRYATRFIKVFKDLYKEVTLLAGNGNHEYLNNVAVIEYLQDISGKIKVITEDHFVEDNIYYGHHMLYESKLEYGTGKCGLKDLKEYKWSFLGHQHSPQDLSKTVFHVGSIRYQNWNEVDDEFKRVAVVEGNKVEFIPLRTPKKMIDVHSLSELPNIEDENSKVRLVISSFQQFKKEINKINEWKDKFAEFKLKLDFTRPQENIEVAKEIKSKKLEEILEEGIAQVDDDDVRKLLKESLK